MSKRTESKYKINRRLGVNLWGRAKSPLNRREYGPGQHGQRRKKPSDYGTQLAAKQKLKGYYANIGERHVLGRAGSRLACDIAQHIHPSEFAINGGEHSINMSGIGHIAGDRQRLVAQLLNGVRRRFDAGRVAVQQHEIGAGLG